MFWVEKQWGRTENNYKGLKAKQRGRKAKLRQRDMTFLVLKIYCWGPLRTVESQVIIIHYCSEPLSSEIYRLIVMFIFFFCLFTTIYNFFHLR